MLILSVPYLEKDAVKALGAKWNPTLKYWFVENYSDYYKFIDWLPWEMKKNYNSDKPVLITFIKQALINHIIYQDEEYMVEDLNAILFEYDWEKLENLLKSVQIPFEKIIVSQAPSIDTEYHHLKGIKVFHSIQSSSLTTNESNNSEYESSIELMLLEDLTLVAFKYKYKNIHRLSNGEIIESTSITRTQMNDFAPLMEFFEDLFGHIMQTLKDLEQ